MKKKILTRSIISVLLICFGLLLWGDIKYWEDKKLEYKIKNVEVLAQITKIEELALIVQPESTKITGELLVLTYNVDDNATLEYLKNCSTGDKIRIIRNGDLFYWDLPTIRHVDKILPAK